jgi:nitrate reductase alpha subunit
MQFTVLILHALTFKTAETETVPEILLVPSCFYGRNIFGPETLHAFLVHIFSPNVHPETKEHKHFRRFFSLASRETSRSVKNIKSSSTKPIMHATHGY